MPASIRRGNARKSLKVLTSTQTTGTTMTTMTSIFVMSFLLLGLTGSCFASPRPDYIQCQNNLECGPGHCCSIGAVRYSTPQCKLLQEEGEVCRPGSQTLNTTVVYPVGDQILLTDVYYILCPCAEGLTCDPKDGICRDLGQKRDTNHLLAENNKRDD